jgi:hypothetical protein
MCVVRVCYIYKIQNDSQLITEKIHFRGCLRVKFFHSFGRILQYSQILQYYIQNDV